MNIAKLLGQPISRLIGKEPFRHWEYERSVDMDVEKPSVDYEFIGKGFDVICGLDESIRTIFLSVGSIDEFEFFVIPFTSTRKQVRELLGSPSRHAEKSVSPILGASGAWDLFPQHGYTVHVEYKIDTDEVNRITLSGKPDYA